jgi:hypothetical protein
MDKVQKYNSFNTNYLICSLVVYVIHAIYLSSFQVTLISLMGT